MRHLGRVLAEILEVADRAVIGGLDEPEKGEALAIWTGEKSKLSAVSLRVEVLDLPDDWREIQPDPDGVITSEAFQSAERIRVQLIVNAP